MRNKMDPKGGKMRIGMASGSGEKMPMKRDRDGELRPAFVVDAEGKAAGGVANQNVPKTKGYFKGGKVMSKGGVAGGAKKKPPGMRYGGTSMKNKMNTKGGKMGGKG
tara:strand:+ start:4753 stop:5073 length:321 start_codon:yes stop_codon:yes gene_type:complete